MVITTGYANVLNDAGEVVFAADGTPEQRAVGLNFYRLGQITTAYYFLYFLVILPILGLVEKPKARPVSITQSVLGEQEARAKARREKEPVVVGGGLAPAE